MCATLSGSYSFASGVGGNAVTLSGGSATLPGSIVSNLTDFSISLWIKPTSLDAWARAFDFGTGTSNYMFFTPKAGTTGLPRFAINSGSGEQVVDSSIAIPINTPTMNAEQAPAKEEE